MARWCLGGPALAAALALVLAAGQRVVRGGDEHQVIVGDVVIGNAFLILHGGLVRADHEFQLIV